MLTIRRPIYGDAEALPQLLQHPYSPLLFSGQLGKFVFEKLQLDIVDILPRDGAVLVYAANTQPQKVRDFLTAQVMHSHKLPQAFSVRFFHFFSLRC